MQTVTDAIIALCLEKLPLELLGRISASYRRRVAPRPKLEGYDGLRTVAPTVVKRDAGYIGHRFNFTYENRHYQVGVIINPHTRRPVYFSVEEPLCHRMVSTEAHITIPEDGSRGTLYVFPRTSTGMVRYIIGAMYIVCKRYNYDLFECRLHWKYATRKQRKNVRRLWIDA